MFTINSNIGDFPAEKAEEIRNTIIHSLCDNEVHVFSLVNELGGFIYGNLIHRKLDPDLYKGQQFFGITVCISDRDYALGHLKVEQSYDLPTSSPQEIRAFHVRVLSFSEFLKDEAFRTDVDTLAIQNWELGTVLSDEELAKRNCPAGLSGILNNVLQKKISVIDTNFYSYNPSRDPYVRPISGSGRYPTINEREGFPVTSPFVNCQNRYNNRYANNGITTIEGDVVSIAHSNGGVIYGQWIRKVLIGEVAGRDTISVDFKNYRNLSSFIQGIYGEFIFRVTEIEKKDGKHCVSSLHIKMNEEDDDTDEEMIINITCGALPLTTCDGISCLSELDMLQYTNFGIVSTYPVGYEGKRERSLFEKVYVGIIINGLE